MERIYPRNAAESFLIIYGYQGGIIGGRYAPTLDGHRYGHSTYATPQRAIAKAEQAAHSIHKDFTDWMGNQIHFVYILDAGSVAPC